MQPRSINVSPRTVHAARSAPAVVAAACVIWLSAGWVMALPGTDVPQTAQTLAVLLAGGVLGPMRGVLAVLLYLAAGAVGLPVFAGGAAGVLVLGGPTAGFLIGFVPAAWVAGHISRAQPALATPPLQILVLLGGLLAAHGLILLLGWVWLAGSLGGAGAFAAGVGPFLAGAVLKSVAATLLLWVLGRYQAGRH